MKKIILFFIIIVTISCKAQKNEPNAVLDKDGNLVGIANKDNFLIEPFNEWFLTNYDAYEVDPETIENIKPLLKEITIKVFMGTWCSDSQDQTPSLYKILDTADFNYDNLELVAVNEDKKTPDNLEKGLNIERVPTFIFYKKGKEIGRFVEYPRESVEADILKIVSGEPYKHAYEKE